MTALSRAATAADVSISVAPTFSSSLPYPVALAIESEKLLVRGGIGTGTLYVDRGQDGTTAATHALGTAVSVGWSSGGGSGVTVDNGTDPPAAVTTLVAPGAVIADGSADLAGVLQFRLLGPFTVTHATPNVSNPSDIGALVTSVPAGSLVRALPFNRVGWNADTPQMEITLSVTAAGPTAELYYPADATTESTGLPNINAEVPSSNQPAPPFALANVDCGVYFQVFTNSGTPSAGETDIYLLIASVA